MSTKPRPANTRWGQRKAAALGVRFSGAPEHIEAMIRDGRSQQGDLLLDYGVKSNQLQRPGLDALFRLARTDLDVSVCWRRRCARGWSRSCVPWPSGKGRRVRPRQRDGTLDQVLASHSAQRFMSYAISTHTHEFNDILNRMHRSARAAVAEVGAQWTTIVWLFDGGRDRYFQECVAGSTAH